MSIVRDITFSWSGLTHNTKVLLCFNKLVESELTSEQNYVAWKVIEARKGNGSATVHYSGRFGFAQSELDAGNIVKGTTFVEMPASASIDFLAGPDGLNTWGPVAANAKLDGLVMAKNKTGFRQDMSVGTFVSNSHNVLTYEPAFLWQGVGDNISIKADFHPTLIAYVGLGYQKNQLITADLSEQEIWTQNLAKLPASSNFDFIETDQGGYKILPST